MINVIVGVRSRELLSYLLLQDQQSTKQCTSVALKHVLIARRLITQVLDIHTSRNSFPFKPSSLCFKVAPCCAENSWESLALQFGVRVSFPPVSLQRMVGNTTVTPGAGRSPRPRGPCARRKHPENQLSNCWPLSSKKTNRNQNLCMFYVKYAAQLGSAGFDWGSRKASQGQVLPTAS